MEEMLRQNSLSLQKPLALTVTIEPTSATTKGGQMRTDTSECGGERKQCWNLRPKNHSPSTLNTLPAGTKTATMRREEGLPLSAREKHQRETLTLSRFSRHRDSAYPHCAILCYLPSPDEPLQNPFALPVTTQPTTATTKGKVRTHTSERGENERMFTIFTNKPFAIYNAHPVGEKRVVVRRLCGDCAETECAGEGGNVQTILSKLLLTRIFTPKPTLQKLLMTRKFVFAPTLHTKP